MTAQPPIKPQNPLSEPGPWNLVSEGYEDVTRPFLAKYSAHGIARLKLTQQHRVLDVACGPGTSTLLAAPAVSHVDALDFSEEMLRIARSNKAQAGLTNVEFHLGDGQALPFADESYDVALSMFGLMFFPDRKQGMRELRRVLRPGGKALVSSWAPVSDSPAMMAMFGALKAIDPTRSAPEADITSLENPDVFRGELEQAGFRQVEVEAVPQTMDYDSPEAFWAGMVKGFAPLVMLRKRVGEAEFSRHAAVACEFLRQHLARERTLTSTAYLAFASA